MQTWRRNNFVDSRSPTQTSHFGKGAYLLPPLYVLEPKDWETNTTPNPALCSETLAVEIIQPRGCRYQHALFPEIMGVYTDMFFLCVDVHVTQH